MALASAFEIIHLSCIYRSHWGGTTVDISGLRCCRGEQLALWASYERKYDLERAKVERTDGM